jgi:hypothetical protein
VHPLHDDKVQHLTNVEFAINATVSTLTTISPFKATRGFEPTSPTTATFEDNEPSRTLPEQGKIMVEMHKFAHDCVKAAQAHMQEAENWHRLPLLFTIGDKVKLKAINLRFVQQPCFKLRDRYIGPFLITEEVSPVAFWLKLPLEYGFMMLYTRVNWKDGMKTRNMPTVRSQFRLCTMRSDLKSTKYSM